MPKKRNRSRKSSKETASEPLADDFLQDSVDGFIRDELFDKNASFNKDFALMERCLENLADKLRNTPVDEESEDTGVNSVTLEHGPAYKYGYLSKSGPIVDILVLWKDKRPSDPDALIHRVISAWINDQGMGKDDEKDHGVGKDGENSHGPGTGAQRRSTRGVEFELCRGGATCVKAKRGDDVLFTLAFWSHSSEMANRRHVNKALDAAFGKYHELSRGVLLLKKWAEAKFLTRHSVVDKDSYADSGINDFTLAILASHVCLSRNLSHDITAFQVFKAVLNFLSKLDPTLMHTFGSPNVSRMDEDPGEYGIKYPFMVHGKSNNILKDMMVTFPQIQFHVRETLKDAGKSAFNLLFTKSLKSELYDTVLYIQLESQDFERVKNIHFVLSYGMRDRINQLHLYPVTGGDGHGLMIGIAYNEGIHRQTDVGPPTDSQEAAFYRKFWPRAETRRFDDGSINECVLWTDPVNFKTKSTCVERALVKDGPNSLNSYIVDKLLEIHGYSGSVVHSEFAITTHLLTAWRNELMTAYNKLNGSLRSLESMPLKILNVTMADEYFSYSDVGPMAYSVNTFHNVNISFESSTAWPAEKEAIQRVKIAFSIAISNELEKSHGLSSKVTDKAQIEVRVGRFFFVLNIVYGKIPSYNPHVDKKPTKEQLAEMGIWYKGVHTNRIRNVALMHPAYSGTVKLAKLWASKCLVENPDFLCEMICACVFSRKCYAPQSASTAFSQFLNIVVTHDWDTKPLVYIPADSPNTEASKINKKQYPGAPFMWIYTPEDPFSIIPDLPCKLLCKRFISKSRQLLQSIEGRYGLFNTSRVVERIYKRQDLHFDMILAIHNPYLALEGKKVGIDKKLEPKGLLEAQFLMKECIKLLNDKVSSICTIAYDKLAISGITRPCNLEPGKPKNHLLLYLKFNPFGFLPSKSIHPKNYPQLAISLKSHKDALGINNNRLLSPEKAKIHSQQISSEHVAIPNFALVLQQIIATTSRVLSHIVMC
ncbi:hypothetical protein BEWA_037240 [Theileria equi strain WA]|uniref:Nucleolar protein 6 n=1 Tax=Theileria equi strain WA TaxID=1537102 RepID=L1LET3_THEEQ|nr:hypothetical protein BEWA_037240 [Theileria equi strain WA]EKX73688.1 hypothetical protein BEWA_037240 [Theileria equi strain WA]|eukprot:XP_004833140.1 hypothetical protein BEWA_037240 [Theileria equi strain WA]